MESQSLLQTEQTDAVNSGIVGRADKSGSALKGNLYSVGKKGVTGGAASAALSAVTKGRRSRASDAARTSGTARAGAPDSPGTLTGAPTETAGTPAAKTASSRAASRAAASRRSSGRAASRKGSSTASTVGTEGTADTISAAQSKRHLRDSLKKGAKGAAVGTATGKALEDSELEGMDDLYYKGRGTYRAARGIKRRISGRNAMETEKSLGALSEKKAQQKTADTVDAQRKAQAGSYFKQSVYTTAETHTKAAATAKAAPAVSAGAAKGSSSALLAVGSTLGQFLPIALLVFIILFAILSGIGAKQAYDSASVGTLDGVAAEVATYLKGYGYTNESIAAILGNMQQESGMNPATGGDDGYGTDSIGLIQLTGSNKVNFLRWCANNGKVWTSVSAQMEWSFSGEPGTGYYINDWSTNLAPSYYELETGYETRFGTDFYRSGEEMKTSTDVDLATYSWMACHERCGSAKSYNGDDVSRLNKRLEYARSFLAQLNSGGYVGGGEDYGSAESWQKAIVDACNRVGWPGASLCATWTSRVYAACGYTVHGNGNSQLGHQGYGASYYPSRATTDLSQIKVGMLVSAQYGSNSAAGNAYGHVGIYIGDGMVMDSISTGIRTISLSDWVSQNNRGWVVCGYPWDWR